MNWPFVNGHAIPPEELDEHDPTEYCSCKPTPIYDHDQLWYQHYRLDNAKELIEAAENLKAATSVMLHQEAELKGLKMKLFPYGMRKIFLPKTGNRQ